MKNHQGQNDVQKSSNLIVYPQQYYEQMLFYAEADLEAAERAVKEKTHFHHKPCFDARECAEKSLKAFLEAAGKQAPDVHSLRTLLRECRAIDKSFQIFQTKCEILNRYIAEARYPDDVDYYFTADTAHEATSIARGIFDFVTERIRRRKDMGLL